MMSKAQKPPKSQSYEEALAELERLVAMMEAGELPLEQSLAAYQRGAELLQACQARLVDAEQQVRVLEAGVLTAFQGSQGLQPSQSSAIASTGEGEHGAS